MDDQAIAFLGVLLYAKHGSSARHDIPSRGTTARYKDGDFIVRAPGCEKDSNRDCVKEIEPFYVKWKESIR